MTAFLSRSLLAAGLLATGLSACAPAAPSQDAQAAGLISSLAADPHSVGEEPQESSALTWGDYSIAAAERVRARRLDRLAALERIDPARLSSERRREFETARVLLATATRLDRHGFGQVGLGWASPYAVTSENGAYLDVTRRLIDEQPIRSAEEADLWLQRLAGLGHAVRQDTVRLQADAAAGVLPPAELLVSALRQVRALGPAGLDSQPLLIHFSSSLEQLPGMVPEVRIRMTDEARAILAEDWAPAMAELARTLADFVEDAPEIGLWRLPRGEAYYADLLFLYCDAELAPAEIHKLALALVEQQTERLNDLLTGLGLSEGSVSDRLSTYDARDAVSIAPAPASPDLAPSIESSLAAELSTLASRAARMSGLPSPALPGIMVAAQPSASGKGTDPVGGVQLSMRGETARVEVAASLTSPDRDWILPSLLAREVIPGRLLMNSAARARANATTLDRVASYPAFEEGWPSHAEDVAAEAGIHDDNLPGRVGYHRSKLLEAAQLAADTGVHNLKWTRAEALLYLQATTGVSAAEAEAVLLGILQRPAQACAPALGREAIRQLRLRAETTMGTRFDAIAFNDLVLSGGPRPMAVLGLDVNDWIDQVVKPSAPPANP